MSPYIHSFSCFSLCVASWNSKVSLLTGMGIEGSYLDHSCTHPSLEIHRSTHITGDQGSSISPVGLDALSFLMRLPHLFPLTAAIRNACAAHPLFSGSDSSLVPG